ncbi:MAG: hypothetical protein IPK55_11680 [Streptococcus sp.]|jgi:hypothetical protein|nr:hypothetical protein [Streptococcus sp.]
MSDDFKEQLATFQVSSIKPEHETKVLKLIIRILNAKLLQTKGKQGKNKEVKGS